MFRPAEMVKVYCLFRKAHLENVLSSLQKIGCVQFFDVKNEYDLSPLKIDELDIATDCLERLDQLLSEFSPKTESSILKKILGPRTVPLCVLEIKPAKEILIRILKKLNEVEEEYQYLVDQLEEKRLRKKRLVEEIRKERIRLLREAFLGPVSKEKLRKSRELSRSRSKLDLEILKLQVELSNFKKKNYTDLLIMREEVSDLVSRLEATKYFGSTRYAIVLGGWTPKRGTNKVIKALETAGKGEVIIQVKEAEKGDDVPVLLDNPLLLKPYEYLTEKYGLPRYDEIDPTPFLAFAFTFFFGVIFADVGFGAALALLSTIVLLKSPHWGEGHRNLNVLLIYLGISSSFFGLAFGEFFGGLLKIQPLWRKPSEDILLLFLITIGVGVLNILLSIFLRLILNIRAGESILYPLSLLLIIFSSCALAAFGTNKPGTIGLSLGLFLLILDKKYRSFEEVIALAANIISYSRIAVLYIVHVTMAKLLVTFLLAIPHNILGVLIGGFLLILTVIVVLIFDVFLIFVTSLRLQWIEFFKRFYSGRGKKFMPFRTKKEYIYTL